ncbi:hypothetical protein M2406_003034 [Serratia sp. BIGb0163]|nr:hypothetical protein [Serratia sp. BIGb0163]
MLHNSLSWGGKILHLLCFTPTPRDRATRDPSARFVTEVCLCNPVGYLQRRLPPRQRTAAAAILMCMSCLPTTAQGAYGGGTTVNANVTVGAAASCIGSNVEFTISDAQHPAQWNKVAALTVTCPGASAVFAGLVGGDGDVGIRTGGTGDGAVGAPIWGKAINPSGSGASLHLGNDNADYVPVEASWGLGPAVKWLQKRDGSTGTFDVMLYDWLKTPLLTGVYPYSLKVYGYWE